VTKEADTAIQETPNGQKLIYFSKFLDLPFKKGDRVNIKIKGKTVVIEKIQ